MEGNALCLHDMTLSRSVGAKFGFPIRSQNNTVRNRTHRTREALRLTSARELRLLQSKLKERRYCLRPRSKPDGVFATKLLVTYYIRVL